MAPWNGPKERRAAQQTVNTREEVYCYANRDIVSVCAVKRAQAIQQTHPGCLIFIVGCWARFINVGALFNTNVGSVLCPVYMGYFSFV